MLKIGVLRGRENSFPEGFIAKVNELGGGEVTAEFIHLGGTELNEPCPYAVILDRMSHEVPYYVVYVKAAMLQGTYVINNPFWRSADDKFFGYAAAEKLGFKVPKTIVLPNKEYIEDVTTESLRNLWPTDFERALAIVGAPAFMKPAFGGGWKNVHKVHDVAELVKYYNESGQLTMMLQEFIDWDDYIRVPTIGRKYARAIRYIPRPMGAGEYVQDLNVVSQELRTRSEQTSIKINEFLGYDMNALEFAVKDGELYGIDLTNYVCDFDMRSLREAHFPWVVETMAKFAIEKARERASAGMPSNWEQLILGNR